MPAASLSPVQQERVDAGLCACGCGGEIERSYWHRSPYAGGNACRQRAYRERRRSGHVLPRIARQRRQLQDEIAKVRAEARHHDALAALHYKAATTALLRLRELEAELGGQLPMFAKQGAADGG